MICKPYCRLRGGRDLLALPGQGAVIEDQDEAAVTVAIERLKIVIIRASVLVSVERGGIRTMICPSGRRISPCRLAS